jgi:hypothetical protein
MIYFMKKTLVLIPIILAVFFNLPVQAAPQNDPCPLGVPKPSKKGQVVRYEKYGFSFEIPANYQIKGEGIFDPALTGMFQCARQNGVRKLDYHEPLSISVKPVSSNVQNLDDFGKPSKYVAIYDKTGIKVGNQSAILYRNKFTGGTGDKYIIAEFFTPDKRYLIHISVEDYKSPYYLVAKQVFYQVIQSFKFCHK